MYNSTNGKSETLRNDKTLISQIGMKEINSEKIQRTEKLSYNLGNQQTDHILHKNLKW